MKNLIKISPIALGCLVFASAELALTTTAEAVPVEITQNDNGTVAVVVVLWIFPLLNSDFVICPTLLQLPVVLLRVWNKFTSVVDVFVLRIVAAWVLSGPERRFCDFTSGH